MKKHVLLAIVLMIVLVFTTFPAPVQAQDGSRGTTVYRALLIGNTHYTPALAGPENDIGRMAALLRLANPGYASIDAKPDLSGSGMLASLQALQTSGIDEDDVTFIYYSGHGYSSGLVGVDGARMSFDNIAAALAAVPGTKIVVLDSCYSGASIGRSIAGKLQSDEPDPADAIKQNVQSAIAAFASNSQSRGNMAQNNFYVLAACSGTQQSSSLTFDGGRIWFGLMTGLYLEGCGMDYFTLKTSTRMPADTNSDKSASLSELENYINSQTRLTSYDQVAQSYPAGSSFALFTQPANVTRIRFSKTRATLYPGDGYLLTAKTTPDALPASRLTWTSSNPAVATVSAEGGITAVSAGKAVIQATSVSGKTAKCTITVRNRVVRLNRKTASIYELQTVKLRASVTPAKTPVTWSTSNAAVATVENGVVYGANYGTAVITATMADGTAASCTVTVRARTVRMNRSKISLYAGRTYRLNARAKVNQTGLTWTTSNAAVAAVDQSGRVSGLTPGQAIITARLLNGQSTSCTVTVKPVNVSSVRLSKTSAKLTAGAAIDLTATVRPANATYPAVVYSSSNESVATVDANGHVTALAKGRANIYATSVNGRRGLCRITVVNP